MNQLAMIVKGGESTLSSAKDREDFTSNTVNTRYDDSEVQAFCKLTTAELLKHLLNARVNSRDASDSEKTNDDDATKKKRRYESSEEAESETRAGASSGASMTKRSFCSKYAGDKCDLNGVNGCTNSESCVVCGGPNQLRFSSFENGSMEKPCTGQEQNVNFQNHPSPDEAQCRENLQRSCSEESELSDHFSDEEISNLSKSILESNAFDFILSGTEKMLCIQSPIGQNENTSENSINSEFSDFTELLPFARNPTETVSPVASTSASVSIGDSTKEIDNLKSGVSTEKETCSDSDNGVDDAMILVPSEPIFRSDNFDESSRWNSCRREYCWRTSMNYYRIGHSASWNLGSRESQRFHLDKGDNGLERDFSVYINEMTKCPRQDLGSPHQQKIVVPKVPKIHILRYVEVPRQEIIVPAYQRSAGKAARLRNEIPNDQNHKNVVVVPRQEVIVPNYVRFTQLPRSRQPDDARTTQVPRKANVAGSDQKQSRRPTGKPVHKYGNVKIPIQERVLPTNQIKPENKTQSEDKSGKTRAGSNHEDLVGGDKIVGGQDANIADYPYQLSLVIWKKYHFCGAALITPKFALTAAHCTYGRPSFDLSIRAGSSKYGTGGELIPIEQVTEHERYWEDNTDYDISLIELASPVTSKDAKPIELIHESPVPGDEAIISGWGRTARGTPSVLQVVKVPVVDQKVCSAAYSKVKNGKFDITDRMFCAGFFKEGGKDACQGDSGGPIVVKGKLAGVVSWGFGCALPKYPGVYTNVANLRDWIEDNISFGYY